MLTPGQKQLQYGEPIVVAVSLQNCSSEARQLEDLLSPEYGFLQVSLSRQGEGKAIRWRPPTMRDARGKRPTILRPGDRFSAWIHLYYSAEGWTLRRPGRYEIRAEYAIDGDSVSAIPVAVEVRAPTTPADAAAADLFMDEAAARLLLAGHEKGEQGSTRLSRLVHDYPNSPLAPYASTALGISLTQERFDPELKVFRAVDCERARTLLESAVQRVADPFIAALGTQALVRCLKTLGREAEAREAINVYGRSHPGGEKLPRVFELLNGLNDPTQAVTSH